MNQVVSSTCRPAVFGSSSRRIMPKLLTSLDLRPFQTKLRGEITFPSRTSIDHGCWLSYLIIKTVLDDHSLFGGPIINQSLINQLFITNRHCPWMTTPPCSFARTHTHTPIAPHRPCHAWARAIGMLTGPENTDLAGANHQTKSSNRTCRAPQIND